MLQAQVVKIESPFPVKVAMDSLISPLASTQSVVRLTGSEPVRLYILADDTVLTQKSIDLNTSEKRRYVIEENGVGGYDLFYRSGSFSDKATEIGTWLPWEGMIPPKNVVDDHYVIPNDSLVPILTETGIDSTPVQGAIGSTKTFEALIEELENTEYEFSRSQLILNWADHNDLTVAQIKELAETSQFDPARFLLLQTLYPKCIDKENYEQLASTFLYPPYQSQFKQWLKQQNETSSSQEQL